MRNKSKNKSQKVDWYREAIRDPLRYGLLSKIRRTTPLNSRHIVIKNFNKPSSPSMNYAESPPPRYSLAIRNMYRNPKSVSKFMASKRKLKRKPKNKPSPLNFSFTTTPIKENQVSGATGYTAYDIPAGNTNEKKRRLSNLAVSTASSPQLPRRSNRLLEKKKY